jgi:hypothetical protein
LDEALDATINNVGILGFNIGFKWPGRFRVYNIYIQTYIANNNSMSERELFETKKNQGDTIMDT